MVAFSRANQQLDQMVSRNISGGLTKSVSEAEKKLQATPADFKFKSADAKESFTNAHCRDKSMVGKTYAYIANGRVYKGHFGWSDAMNRLISCGDGEA